MGMSILILAGAMFMVPIIIMIPTAVMLDGVPDCKLTIGGWSMGLSAIFGVIGVVFTMNGA